MAMSTAGPGWPDVLRGAYTVHPTPGPGPSPANTEPISSSADGISSQKLTLLRRGKAMSGAPIISGTNQLPKPPMKAGMTMKNTMIRPWEVIRTLKN